MSAKPLKGRFISPTGALQPACETAALQQIMTFVKTIDLEELADFDGDVRIDKYYDLFPKPEALQNFAARAKEYEGPLFKVKGGEFEFADDGSEDAKKINAFLQGVWTARQSHEDAILERYPTALEADVFFEIEDRLREKAKREELEDLMDADEFDEPFAITLIYEGESSNADKLREFFSDIEMLRAFQAEKPEMWADIEQKIALHADMVPIAAVKPAPANG